MDSLSCMCISVRWSLGPAWPVWAIHWGWAGKECCRPVCTLLHLRWYLSCQWTVVRCLVLLWISMGRTLCRGESGWGSWKISSPCLAYTVWCSCISACEVACTAGGEVWHGWAYVISSPGDYGHSGWWHSCHIGRCEISQDWSTLMGTLSQYLHSEYPQLSGTCWQRQWAGCSGLG